MNEKAFYEKFDCYFASANGYKGFKSYFSNVFSPELYEKIFILKGGPGTGKSSLMKRLITELGDKAKAEAIICSSDSASLDGVILKSKDKSVAIIDGTAPHTVDPIYPGSSEEIINLGQGWRSALLKNNRDNIEKLTKIKAQAYTDAYDYLKICGSINSIIKDDLGPLAQEADIVASSIVDSVTAKGSVDLRLISSLGKNGFGYLRSFEKRAAQIYKVVGIYGSEYLFINKIKHLAEIKNSKIILSPSPLSESQYDAIFFPEEKIAIICGNRALDANSSIIDTAKLLNQATLSEKRSKLEFLWKEHETLLWSASDSFRKASEAHFELEKIYVAAMNFTSNDNAYKKMRNEICEILGIPL